MRKMKVLSLVLAAALVVTGSNVSTSSVSAAKKPAVAKKKTSVKAGATVKVKVKNATAKTKVKWSVSSKKVIKISKKTTKGKNAYAVVKGVTVGKADLKAVFTVGKKKYNSKCTVTVTKAADKTAETTAANATASTATASAVATTSASATSAANNGTSASPAASGKADATKTPAVKPSKTPKVVTPTPVPTPKYTKPAETAPPVASEAPANKEIKATFDCAEHASITTYKTQKYDDAEGTAENQTEAVARDKETGEALSDGTGQINFTVVLEDGYEVDKVEVTPEGNFGNCKGSTDTKKDNTYRITNIKGDIAVKVTVKEKDPNAVEITSYKVKFQCDEHAGITVYKTEDYDTSETMENQTEAVSRDEKTGEESISGGQVNFKVVLDDGYEVESVTATPEDNYKNLKTSASTASDKKPLPENTFKLTKITGDITVVVKVKAVSK